MIFHEAPVQTGVPVPGIEAALRGSKPGKVKPAPLVFVVVVLVILIAAMLICFQIRYTDGATAMRELAVAWVSGMTGLFFGERMKAS